MVLNRLIILIALLSISFLNIFSQEPQYDLRSLNLSLGDSIIKTHTINSFPKKKPIAGTPYFWYSSGKIEVNYGGYSGKLIHGKYEVFCKGTKLIKQGNFQYGLKQGLWKEWYLNGIQKEALNYHDGLLEGECMFYDKNGILLFNKNFHKGVLHGRSFSYLPDTVIEKRFKYGKEIVKKDRVDDKQTKANNFVLKEENSRQVLLNDTISQKKKPWFRFMSKEKTKKKQKKNKQASANEAEVKPEDNFPKP